jgi:transposase InsO family protein
MNGEAPKFFIRDHDDTFGAVFDRVARGSGMRVIKTAVHAPNMNAVMERFLRSVRTEVLDQVLVFDERRLERVLREYVKFFNGPHGYFADRPETGALQAARRSRGAGTSGTHDDIHQRTSRTRRPARLGRDW